MKPVTEMSNDLTKNIDTSLPIDIVKQLEQCDCEIFHGWEGSEGLLNETFLRNLTEVAYMALRLFHEEQEFSVILSGCGSSGRLSYVTARNFNKQLVRLGMKPCFDYLIAGGDLSLFASRESAEDNPLLGIRDLEKASHGQKKVLYIGITCGFTAGYVAGQLDFCMNNLDRFIPILLGFNPVSASNTLPIEKWNKTFSEVALNLQEMQLQGKGFILNPIIGPEPISGSSRMKGGTATKIILETLFTAALYPQNEKTIDTGFLRELILSYKATGAAVYRESKMMSRLIEAGSKSLLEGGQVCYMSSGTAGFMSQTDASECPPTFGADANQVRGFLEEGYSELQNKEGDLSDEFQISNNYFREVILPSLTPKDLVLVLQPEEIIIVPSTDANVLSVSIRSFKEKDLVGCSSENEGITLPDYETGLDVPSFLSFHQYLQKEMAMKWLCNCFSSGAFTRSGKVFNNYMVDVRVSNKKLFHRAAGIIGTICECSKERSYQLLLKSIYHVDELPDEYQTLAISTLVEKATPIDKVVPVALVLGLTNFSVAEAKKILMENPIVRAAIVTVSK